MSAAVERSGLLTVVGDLVEDVVVWPAGEHRHGTDNPSVITRTRGGSAANVAAHAAAAVPTRFVGRVGDEPLGTQLVTSLAALGVDVRAQVHAGGRTGTVVVVVDASGERTMYPDRGAAVELAPITADDLAGTTVLHVPAYGFASPQMTATLLGAVDTVRRAGAMVTVDVSAVSLVDQLGADTFRGLLATIAPEIVFANRPEAVAAGIADRRPPPGRTVIVKDGAAPALVMGHDDEPVAVPAPHVDRVLDTTGAGDAFAAGFLAATISGAGAVEACRAGHRAAGAVLATPGAVVG